MRKSLFRTMMLLLLTMISVGVFAIPANKQAVTIKQPNGKYLTLIPCGDENVHWAKTIDQYTLVRNQEGFFTYGVLDERGNLVASNYLAANAEERSAEERAFLATLPVNLFYSQNQIEAMKAASPTAMITDGAKYPTHGTVKLLVILVGFSDLPFTYTNQDFVNLVSQDNYNGTGSVKDYYRDNSDGQFIMDIDVAGPYTLPNSMAYYGGNNQYGSDQNMVRFVSHSLNAADPDVDYSDYDNDGDGRVDAVHIIFAGTPESSTQIANEIWPHRSNVSNEILKDGMRFGPYSCSAEKRNVAAMDGIGTICHEFGHVLGFPDFYDTDYTGNGGNAVTPGDWDLMASGSYMNNSATPVGLSAFERWIANWFTFDTLSTTSENNSLPALNNIDTTVAYYVELSTNEFFVIENRKKTGWDTYLPGEGLLIYHGDWNKINPWFTSHSNTINVTPSNRGYFLRPASGNEGDVETNRCPFPGATGNTNFTDNTNPASTLKNGTLTGKPITNIRYENDSVMLFNFMSNLPAVVTDTVSASSITSGTAVVWSKIVYEPSGEENAITSRGIVWSTDQQAIADLTEGSVTFAVSDSTNTSYPTQLTGLTPSSIIYCRAYATNANGTVYGGTVQFNTRSGLATITTRPAQNVGMTSATVEGNYTSVGEGEFIAKGFTFTTDPNENPEVDGNMVYVSTDPTTGSFTYTIDTLTDGMKYYYRAYVTTTLGTAYGTKRNFQTTVPPIENNTIGSSQEFCVGTTPQLLVGSEPTGGKGNFTYQWQEKKRTGSWYTATQNSTEKDYQPEVLEDSTYYRRIVISNGMIKDTSNTVLMNVLVSRGGRINKTVGDTIAVGESTGNLGLVGYRGEILSWERQIDEQAWETIQNQQASYSEVLNTEALYTYRAKVQLSTCPEAYSSSIQIYAKDYSSLQDVENGFEFVVSPNPASSYLTIQAQNQRAESIVITNVLGQVVYSENDCDLNNKTINLEAFENGTYLIGIISEGKQSVKQLIINK
ncbi:MAG: M6 family metalloprotease domain-containing protein [Bacteroidales bacterium]|nr:M6 family metalloprotease domain-containing protein [Bacteroidales bacterium]